MTIAPFDRRCADPSWWDGFDTPRQTHVQALIIAAGRGTRLSPASRGLPKPLVPVLGVPIVDRALAALRSVGVDDVVVTVGHEGQRIRDHLGDGTRFGVHVHYAENTASADGNARSVLAAAALLNGEFMLVMGDHLVDERILAAMLEERVAGDVLLAVDRRPSREGATRVIVEDGAVRDIDKELATWNATDIGVMRCAPTFLDQLDELIQTGVEELAEAIHGVDARSFDIATIDPYMPKLRKPVSPWWVDVDTPADVADAERLLVDNASKAASDALAHWVHRPVENALVAPLARSSRITPNQLSFAVNVLAYTVTALFATGALLAASLLTFVVGLADGLDGKLARVTQHVTRVGSLEHAFDMLYEYSWVLALAWAVRRDDGGGVPLLLAGVTVAIIAFYRSVYDQYGKQAGHSLDDATNFDRCFRRVAGRRNLYNVWIVAAVVAGAPLAALWAIATHAAITASVYSARTITLLRRLDRTGGMPPRPSTSG